MPAAPTCVAVRHVAFEDLGVWELEIRAHGYEVAYVDAGVDDLGPARDADLTVVLGGPIGVGDDALYPFLAGEIELVRARLAAGRPTVGVCLGAQLMAAALGARVYPGQRELGWGVLELAAGAAQTPLRHLRFARVLHWHQDTFDLPDGATVLASTPETPHQAFAVGRSLALQFHAEIDAESIERWLVGHTSDLRSWGVDIVGLRADSAAFGDEAAIAGVALIRDYLRGLTFESAR